MDFLNIQSENDLCSYLNIKIEELKYLLYTRKPLYKTYDKAKKSGGTRKISVPNRQLKYVQRRIANGLSNYYHSKCKHSFIHGFVNGKSISSNASVHLNSDFVLNVDLENFFPSITFKRIHGLLTSKKAFNFPNDVAIMITKLVTYNDELPQGAPTSPIISNLIAYKLDNYFHKMMKLNKDIRYTRYADDITFSGNFESLHLVYDSTGQRINPKIEAVVIRNCFNINNKKTRLQTRYHHQEVTGIKVNMLKNVSKDYLYKLRSMIHSLEKYGLEKSYEKYCKKKHIVYDEKKANQYIKIIIGMISYMKMIKGDDDQVYVSLAKRINKILNKNIITYVSSYEEIANDAIFQAFGAPSDALGTCFRVKDYIVTCKHCVENDICVRVIRSDKTKSTESVLYMSKEHDLALISTNGFKSSPYINISKEKISFPLNVKIFGFPMADENDNLSIQNGQITSFQYLKENDVCPDFYYVMRAAIQPGNSGGPVLDENNNLVAMVCIGNDNPATNQRNGALSSEVILEEIKKYESQKKQ